MNVVLGPKTLYHSFPSAIGPQCSTVRPGMTEEQVLEILHRKKIPYIEDASQASRWIFVYPGIVCTVEFNSETKAVDHVNVNQEAWPDGDILGSY